MRIIKTTPILALTLLILLLTACGGGSETTDTAPPASVGDAVKGQTLFQQSCASCHGLSGEGVPGLGKDMTDSDFINGLSDVELVEFIKQGRPASDPLNTTNIDMPPKGGNPALSDDDLHDIVAFIRSIRD